MTFSKKIQKILDKRFNNPDSKVLLEFSQQPVKLVFDKNNPDHGKCIKTLDTISKVQKFKSNIINQKD
jgi:hypothetical protein